MNSVTVKADTKFLRRVLMALVALTLLSGGVTAFTTVQAMHANRTCDAGCS